MNLMKVLYIIFLISCFLLTVFYYEPRLRFWNTVEENEIIFCLQHKPKFNISSIEGLDFVDERISKCYGEYWYIYCEFRSPQNC